MESAPVSSFAKIDMSLDEIIKLNKKDKKAKAAKGKATSSSLTVAQKQRASTLKAKARRTQSKQPLKPGRFPPKKTNNAGIRGKLNRKSKVAMTKAGSVTNAGKGQKTKTTSQASHGGRGRQQTIRKSRGGAYSRNTLGVRIQNAQKNQSTKRQQLVNQKRPGLQSVRGSGARRSRGNTTGKRNNSLTRSNPTNAQNRKYNQQPRRQYGGQQARGRGQSQQQRGRGRHGRGRASGRTVTLY